jgi:hypothetical protein
MMCHIKTYCSECGLDIMEGEYFFKLVLHEMLENDISKDQTEATTKPIFIHTGCFLSQEGE